MIDDHDTEAAELRAEIAALRSLLADLFAHALAEFALASEFDWTIAHYDHPSTVDELFARVEAVLGEAALGIPGR